MLDLFRNRKKSMYLAALLVLVVALLAPAGAAYADGEPPPEPPPAENVGEPEPLDSAGEDGDVNGGEETHSPDPLSPAMDGESAPPPLEATGGEGAAGENAVEVGEEAASASSTEETSTDEAQSEEDEVVRVPLASVDSLAPVTAPDPYFTLGGILYSFFGPAGACGGAANCQDGLAAPIQAAINYLSGNNAVPDDNTVYVEAGTYTEDDTIDGSAWTTTPAQFILHGVSGSGSTTIDGTLTIQAMLDFILRGFSVTGGVSASGNTGALTLEDVVVDGAAGDGLSVSSHSGDVQVTNSSFNNNGGAGLNIAASGSVVVEDVEASGNFGGDGATLIADAITARRSIFNNNADGSSGPPDDPGQGLFMRSNGGPILVENVTAMGNEESGAYLSHQTSNSMNEITVASSSFKSNGRFGVYAQPNGGKVTFDCIQTSGNAHGGTLVPIGETVEWIKCECREEHEKDPGYISKPLDEEFPVIINAGNGIVVTFPAIEKIEKEKVAWGVAEPLKEKQLPAALPPEDAFRAGVKTQVINALIPEGSVLIVEFYIPGFMMEFEFVVYWWDAVAEEWVEIPFTIEPNLRSAGGRIIAEWPEMGIFVLVTR